MTAKDKNIFNATIDVVTNWNGADDALYILELIKKEQAPDLTKEQKEYIDNKIEQLSEAPL